MARVALVTTDPAWVGDDDDRVGLLDALRALGITHDEPEWSDPQVRWRDDEPVVMRSSWDYSVRLDEFLAWLSRVEAETQVLNCPDLIRWNLEKQYVQELRDADVPVVPSAFATTAAAADARIAAVDAPELIVKPNVSAGSRDTGRFGAGDPRANDLARHIFEPSFVVSTDPSAATRARAVAAKL